MNATSPNWLAKRKRCASSLPISRGALTPWPRSARKRSDTPSRRFSKTLALQALDARVGRIAKAEKFDRRNGTSQLKPKERMSDEDVRRAVEYGRMRAFEQFAEAIEEGFRFEPIPPSV